MGQGIMLTFYKESIVQDTSFESKCQRNYTNSNKSNIIGGCYGQQI